MKCNVCAVQITLIGIELVFEEHVSAGNYSNCSRRLNKPKLILVGNLVGQTKLVIATIGDDGQV